jgi:hypothetical protein
MTHEEQAKQELWDDYRDGSLPSEQHQQFESYLKSSPQAQAIFDAESNWLNDIASTDAAFDIKADLNEDLPTQLELEHNDENFTASIINQWQSTHDHSPAVAGRIGFARWQHAAPWIKAATSIAALIAITAIGLLVGNALKTPTADPIAANPNNNTNDNTTANNINTTTINPITAMLQGTRNNAAIAAVHPTRIKQTVADTVALLDVNALMDLIDPGVPDPATFIEPAEQAS